MRGDYQYWPKTMLDRLHLQPINPNPKSAASGERNDSQIFPRLAPELRAKLWCYAFDRQRVIEILSAAGSEQLVNRRMMWQLLLDYSDVTPPEEGYTVFAQGPEQFNKFLRVCRESRAEVLRVYRIQIPCQLLLESIFGSLIYAASLFVIIIIER